MRKKGVKRSCILSQDFIFDEIKRITYLFQKKELKSHFVDYVYISFKF